MRARKFLYNVGDWLRDDLLARVDRRVLIAGGVAAVAIVVVALIAILSDSEPEGETRVVTVAVASDDPQEAPVGTLGFPLIATRNTTRVGGPDAITDAAATALATHPPAPDAEPIEAAVLIADGNWQAGIAAAALAGPPLRAPLLIGDRGEVPDATAQALAQLQPRGGSGPADAAVYRVGGAAAPSDLQSKELRGSSAEIAAAIDELRGRLLGGEPAQIVVATSEKASYAMPAAAWAARSGDPVLFSGARDVPEATMAALRRHRGVPVYVLGPESAISDEALRKLERASPGVKRVGAEDPVANAIAFARYADSSFGWDINDPGHGLVLANSSRPLDAAAAATLAASGKWGPLLVTETAGALPAELRSFLLDIKPGYEDDPTRAVYNHIWLIGDASAIGARVQAEIDELAELAPIGRGTGTAAPATDDEPGFAIPGGPEGEPQAEKKKGRQ
jgi:Cell wall binding domain 2 (CWB2)